MTLRGYIKIQYIAQHGTVTADRHLSCEYLISKDFIETIEMKRESVDTG